MLPASDCKVLLFACSHNPAIRSVQVEAETTDMIKQLRMDIRQQSDLAGPYDTVHRGHRVHHRLQFSSGRILVSTPALTAIDTT